MDANEVPLPAVDPAPQLVPPLNQDGREEFDCDSAYAGSIAGTDTTSLKSSVMRYREENGRTYHSYGSTEHWGPNDPKAQEQQDLSHHVWVLALKGALYLAPVHNPQRILDLGTGTGLWAIEVAEQHPEAVVDGIDISPIQPTWTPPNVRFIVDDYNAEWLDVEKFDLIHARELLGYANRVSRALKPGGWFDQAEPSLFFTSDLTKLDENHPYTLWGRMMVEAGNKAGMRFDIGPHIKGWMEEAGFVNVHEIRQAWTIGGWSKDQHQREVGQWNQVRLDEGVKDFCSRRFTNQMGLKPEEVELFCMTLRAALRQKRLYGYQWANQRAPPVQAPALLDFFEDIIYAPCQQPSSRSWIHAVSYC